MMTGWKRVVLKGGMAAAMAVLCAGVAMAQAQQWRATWAASPSSWRSADPFPPILKPIGSGDGDETIRNIVHVTAAGEQARIRVSNVFGTEPLVITAAHVGLQKEKSAIAPGTDREVTFGGLRQISIPPGADALSDPISLGVPAGANLAVTVAVSGHRSVYTLHVYGLQTSYIAPGSQAAAAELDKAAETTSWLYLTEVQVAGKDSAKGTIVAFGDSITDGALTKPDMNQRWPDQYYSRLQAAHKDVAVTNAGIIGNRLLHDAQGKFGAAFGVNALARFDRDVLNQAGVRAVVILLGINDIGQPGTDSAPADSAVTVEAMEQALQQLATRAHQRGVKVYAGTLLPFGAAKSPGYYSPEKDAQRKQYNAWIRKAGADGRFDGVVDFEKAVQDPADPDKMQAAFDGGDHLHPNGEGDKALAGAVPVELLK